MAGGVGLLMADAAPARSAGDVGALATFCAGFFCRSGEGIVGTRTSARHGVDVYQPVMNGRQRSRAGASGLPSASGTSRQASSRWRAGGLF